MVETIVVGVARTAMVIDAFVGHAAGVPAGTAPLLKRRESLVVERGGRAARQWQRER
jgi:hypothetical protein